MNKKIVGSLAAISFSSLGQGGVDCFYTNLPKWMRFHGAAAGAYALVLAVIIGIAMIIFLRQMLTAAINQSNQLASLLIYLAILAVVPLIILLIHVGSTVCSLP